jgi:hypothetical protein
MSMTKTLVITFIIIAAIILVAVVVLFVVIPIVLGLPEPTTPPLPPTTETQQQEQQPQGLVEEQSPTAEVQQPLTVAVDRPSYSTGDTITITGTVAEREPGSDVLVEVTDPQGNQDWLESATVTADNTYQVEIEAGEPQYSFSEDVMDTSGTYLVTAGYFTPEPNRDVVRAETTFEFTAED